MSKFEANFDIGFFIVPGQSVAMSKLARVEPFFSLLLMYACIRMRIGCNFDKFDTAGRSAEDLRYTNGRV